MKYTSEQAFKAAKEVLTNNRINYIELGAPVSKPGYKYDENNNKTDVWMVSYTYMVFEEEEAFIYLDDVNELKLLYIITKHGYLTY